jgi:hypothetical protein
MHLIQLVWHFVFSMNDELKKHLLTQCIVFREDAGLGA